MLSSTYLIQLENNQYKLTSDRIKKKKKNEHREKEDKGAVEIKMGSQKVDAESEMKLLDMYRRGVIKTWK